MGASILAPVMPSLRRLRLEAGLSQESLAERAGVTSQTIYELERGLRRARPSTMRKIAQALGVSIPEVVEFAERLGAGEGRDE